jgi:hypothetical protein
MVATIPLRFAMSRSEPVAQASIWLSLCSSNFAR